MEIRILSMSAQCGGEEICLRVELCSGARGGEDRRDTRELVILTDRYAELRPTKGAIDEETYFLLEEAAEFCTAVRMGARILAFAANTKKGLARKLVQKGVKSSVAASAADYLEERGYISETDDVEREVRAELRKLRGKNRILAALREKGFSDDAMERAVEYLSEVDFVGNCRALICKRFGGEEMTPELFRKLSASMMRSGYNMNEVREAVRRIAADRRG